METADPSTTDLRSKALITISESLLSIVGEQLTGYETDTEDEDSEVFGDDSAGLAPPKKLLQTNDGGHLPRAQQNNWVDAAAGLG
ncbi:hypothetical protein HDU96_010601 [Phlyctochytrium bullatum]|nr:hypothetical protein HDU96_010601 [Phlyctochytrium bullatum]